MTETAYDPRATHMATFHDAIPNFLDGSDTPRHYLERCLETIELREPDIKAFVVTNKKGARRAADESTRRYETNRTLSLVDGMPVCIKDLYETADMPTQMNSPVYAGWESHRDAAHVYALRKGGAAIVGKTVHDGVWPGDTGSDTQPFRSPTNPGRIVQRDGRCRRCRHGTGGLR